MVSELFVRVNPLLPLEAGLDPSSFYLQAHHLLSLQVYQHMSCTTSPRYYVT